MKHIVILGGSYAGISTAHRILKQAAKTGPFKITLVSPNTHLYWNIAAPRGLVPGQLSDEDLFQPIADGFSQYSASQFEFVIAYAENLDFDAKTVGISGNKTLNYDFLILATGSHTKGDAPFKELGSTEATKDALHTFQVNVEKAKTIVIAGAGVTGVEAAGELGFEYGAQKEIILIASGSAILEEGPASVSKLATKELQSLKVEIKFQKKVTASTPLPDGRQELTFSDGDKLITNMYVPTFGLIANSSYIPAKYLNSDGFVMVDDYLQVKGAGTVWALGDVADVGPSQFTSCDRQSAHLAKNIVSILSNKPPIVYKPLGSPFMGLSIGKKAGTGFYGNIKLPSFLVIFARKTLFTERLQPTVNGSMF